MSTTLCPLVDNRLPHLFPVQRLRLLRCGLLHLQLVEEGVGLRLPVLDELAIGLHLGLIPYGIQDDPLLRHLLQLGDDELRLHLRHAQGGSLLLRISLLHGLRLFLLLLHLILLLRLR
ncbi:hypothetical protein D1007_21176 [Hordeum vulgare]|nr:hypothetical protein D1007_21176 [Hordeum vulgare]